jgi:hypothetical protein
MLLVIFGGPSPKASCLTLLQMWTKNSLGKFKLYIKRPQERQAVVP